MSFFPDSNIFIYAIDPTSSEKHNTAKGIVDRWLSSPTVLPRQILGEILNVGHKRHGPRLEACREMVAMLEDATVIAPTTRETMAIATEVTERYKLQFWDALIFVIGTRAGASTFLTEDMHDGLNVGSSRIINPFASANFSLVDELLR